MTARAYGGPSQGRQYGQQGYYQGSYERHQDDMPPPPPPPPPPGSSYTDAVQARAINGKWAAFVVVVVTVGLSIVGWTKPSESLFAAKTRSDQPAAIVSASVTESTSQKARRERLHYLTDDVKQGELLGQMSSVRYPWRHDANGHLEVQYAGGWQLARKLDDQSLVLLPAELAKAKKGEVQSVPAFVWTGDMSRVAHPGDKGRRFRGLDLSDPHQLLVLFGNTPLVDRGADQQIQGQSFGKMVNVSLSPDEYRDILAYGSATQYRNKLVQAALPEDYQGRSMNEQKQLPTGRSSGQARGR